MRRILHQYFSSQYLECQDKSLDWKILAEINILFILFVERCWIATKSKLQMVQELCSMIVQEKTIKSGLFSDFFCSIFIFQYEYLEVDLFFKQLFERSFRKDGYYGPFVHSFDIRGLCLLKIKSNFRFH